ncbi:hypothetical protein CMI46_02080 [Candidatus Pacearchaeota archaeon]|nr:hypothetical protein [Candidatus Pacearchaeota archaeon]|tara:strand:+ start:11360 stop:11980 length:621 start_codon:yes stop_codon:yes gene_type:complete
MSNFMDKRVAVIFVVCVAIVLSFSFVMAHHKEGHNPPGLDKPGKNSTNKTIPVNYGQCVKVAGVEKRACYKEVRADYKNCRYDVRLLRKLDSNLSYLNFSGMDLTLPGDRKNRTEMRAFRGELRSVARDCRNNYKEVRRSCMADFKEAKLQCKALKCEENEEFVDGECVEVECTPENVEEDCEGKPHIEIPGAWGCVEGICVWEGV